MKISQESLYDVYVTLEALDEYLDDQVKTVVCRGLMPCFFHTFSVF